MHQLHDSLSELSPNASVTREPAFFESSVTVAAGNALPPSASDLRPVATSSTSASALPVALPKLLLLRLSEVRILLEATASASAVPVVSPKLFCSG